LSEIKLIFPTVFQYRTRRLRMNYSQEFPPLRTVQTLTPVKVSRVTPIANTPTLVANTPTLVATTPNQVATVPTPVVPTPTVATVPTPVVPTPTVANAPTITPTPTLPTSAPPTSALPKSEIKTPWKIIVPQRPPNPGPQEQRRGQNRPNGPNGRPTTQRAQVDLSYTQPCKNVVRGDSSEHFGVCTNPNCTYAHSLQEFRLAPCSFGLTCCRKLGEINADCQVDMSRMCMYRHPDETVEEYYQRTRRSRPDLPETSAKTRGVAQPISNKPTMPSELTSLLHK